jgi:hypothetical protein
MGRSFRRSRTRGCPGGTVTGGDVAAAVDDSVIMTLSVTTDRKARVDGNIEAKR